LHPPLDLFFEGFASKGWNDATFRIGVKPVERGDVSIGGGGWHYAICDFREANPNNSDYGSTLASVKYISAWVDAMIQSSKRIMTVSFTVGVARARHARNVLWLTSSGSPTVWGIESSDCGFSNEDDWTLAGQGGSIRFAEVSLAAPEWVLSSLQELWRAVIFRSVQTGDSASTDITLQGKNSQSEAVGVNSEQQQWMAIPRLAGIERC